MLLAIRRISSAGRGAGWHLVLLIRCSSRSMSPFSIPRPRRAPAIDANVVFRLPRVMIVFEGLLTRARFEVINRTSQSGAGAIASMPVAQLYLAPNGWMEGGTR